MGSTKNGRDSESKRLGVKRAAVSTFSQATFSFVREAHTFTQVTT